MSADVDNKEIVEGPATGKDKIVICAVHMQEIFREIGKGGKITDKDAKTVIKDHIVIPILSTELNVGMTIKASSYEKQAKRGEAR